MCVIFAAASIAKAQFIVEGQVLDASTKAPLSYATLASNNYKHTAVTDANGHYSLELEQNNISSITVRLVGFEPQEINVDTLTPSLDIYLHSESINLETVVVQDKRAQNLVQTKLRDVDGTAIYAGRKNELILPERMLGNLATNNARELFKGVAGLTVWENDGGGLQLSIGARGLNPNRSSNFNTRQNGYDISADALGYPESYYTPPAQALKRIELVRGAASLQYGTQFGGLLNFKLKEGNPNKKFSFQSEQTAGSFGLLNTFNAVSGTIGKISYYGFGQYKTAKGWRENSGYNQTTGYLNLEYKVNPKLKLAAEFTKMKYLAQQPGGLVDFEFERNPRISKRNRNWFNVDWNLAALHFDYKFSDKTKLNIRTFYLAAKRLALGELGPINRPDPLRERTLISGHYANFGQEIRLLHRYKFKNRPATFVTGTRLYHGNTESKQGLANKANDASFEFLNPNNLEQYNYKFPSKNYAFFIENIIPLGYNWTLTPGLRAEYIKTAADGNYRILKKAGTQTLIDTTIGVLNVNPRAFLIAGLGLSYRTQKGVEIYANSSQNYRAINFSDMVVVNPNIVIDSNLTDERGFNLELGSRGNLFDNNWTYDISTFFLRYTNRIGIEEVLIPDDIFGQREISKRTNIGAANIYGLEVYSALNLSPFIGLNPKKTSVQPFINASFIDGRYVTGSSSVINKKVESIPPISIKTGVDARHGNWGAQILWSYVHKHFSDATNATLVADATRGIIPTYHITDVSLSYKYKFIGASIGTNNLFNATYFTRRAVGYPGPGIIPSEGRSIYATLKLNL